MNLLAHLHLGSELSPLAATGNFIADFCSDDGPEGFAKGIRYHWKIDGFTDSHPETLKARALFGGKIRRFSGVLVDLAFDYLLARHWDSFASLPREEFIDREFARMSETHGKLTDQSADILDRIKTEAWLESYTTIPGLAHTLRRLAIRRPVAGPLVGAESLIREKDGELEKAFLRFYPLMEEKARGWRST
ncbi:MAG: ACP phosphodiesterase [Verrucomicrobiota bacterium]